MHTVFQGVTVLAGLAALLFTAQSLNYTAEATNATRDQVRLAERGQVTDRFSRAIDQLGQAGNDRLSIRLGGIYALERLMRDSPPDEPTVIEVLCAFVRTNALRPNVVPATVSPSPPDVLAAITVLARRPQPGTEGNGRLDLRGALLGLSGARLTGAHLGGADLSGADLSGAELSGADLSLADLSGANLSGADLSSAQLDGAILGSAQLDGTDLSGANLSYAYLRSAQLDGARLRGADLGGANLVGADLGGAYLDGADLNGTNLRRADLGHSRGLSSEQLVGSDIDGDTVLPTGVAQPSPVPTR